MNILQIAQARYTTKAFDKSRRIPDDQVEQIAALLRLSPSSTNAQPWHFVLAGTEEGKARIAKSATGLFAFNRTKITHASHVVVLCARASIDESYLLTVLDQEDKDGRLDTPEAREGQHRRRCYFANAHRFEMRDVQHWLEKQVYLAAGTLLLGAATLEIDACPMEGFDQKILDEELDLRAQGLTSSLIIALGYRSSDDFNAKLPKSRLPEAQILTRI